MALLERLIWAGLFFGIPLGIAVLMGAHWLDIAKAFAILALICALLGFISADNMDQRLMWAGILWMVGCIPGIPLILLAMRLLGFR